MREGNGSGPLMTVKRLRHRQRQVLQLYLDGLTIPQIAKRLGVDKRKISKWLNRLTEPVARLEAGREVCLQRRTLALLEQVVRKLKRMLKSRDRRAVTFAISAILKLNERLPEIHERFEYLRRLRDGPPVFIQPRPWRGSQLN